MIRGIYTAVAGMLNEMARQEVVASTMRQVGLGMESVRPHRRDGWRQTGGWHSTGRWEARDSS